MRLSQIPLLALLVAGAGGCATGAQTRYPAPQGYANPGQWSPLAQPGQPQWSAPGQPSAPAYPGFFSRSSVRSTCRRSWRSRAASPALPGEVAPGTWVMFDCAPFQALSRAIQYIPFVRYNFLPSGPLPAAVDHRADGTEGPVEDQGRRRRLHGGLALDGDGQRHPPHGPARRGSALHVWSRYGVPITGKAGDSNLDQSVAVEETWQYDPVKACKLVRSPMDTCTTAYGVSSGSEVFDPSLKAEHATADASGRYKLTAVEQLHAKPADINEIAGVLASGDDVWDFVHRQRPGVDAALSAERGHPRLRHR